MLSKYHTNLIRLLLSLEALSIRFENKINAIHIKLKVKITVNGSVLLALMLVIF